jgi:hypothetical protein
MISFSTLNYREERDGRFFCELRWNLCLAERVFCCFTQMRGTGLIEKRQGKKGEQFLVYKENGLR